MMDSKQLRALKRALRDWFKEMLAPLIRKQTLGTASADGFEEAEGWGAETGEPDYTYSVRRMQHYGFASDVPAGAEILSVSVTGGSNNRTYVASELPNTRPGLEGGEVALYSKYGQIIRLTKDGNIVLVPAAGSSLLLGDGSEAACDAVITESKLQLKLDTIKTHTHPTPAGASSQSAELNVPGALTITGSPNTKAKT